MTLAAKAMVFGALILAGCDGEAVPVNQVDRRGEVPNMVDGEWQKYCAQNDLDDVDNADCIQRARIERRRGLQEAIDKDLRR